MSTPVRLTRPPVVDAREWLQTTRDALNAAGVSIGDDFLIVRADDYPEIASAGADVDGLLAPGAGGVRRTDPGTSRKAAGDVAPRTGTQRGRLLGAIVAAGDDGLISEEAAELAGVEFARSSGPRLAELKAGGWIRTTGKTRLGSLGSEQDVLVATDKGRAAAADMRRG